MLSLWNCLHNNQTFFPLSLRYKKSFQINFLFGFLHVLSAFPHPKRQQRNLWEYTKKFLNFLSIRPRTPLFRSFLNLMGSKKKCLENNESRVSLKETYNERFILRWKLHERLQRKKSFLTICHPSTWTHRTFILIMRLCFFFVIRFFSLETTKGRKRKFMDHL